MANLSPDQLHSLLCDTFVRCNTSKSNADSVASALLAAELAGQTGHGLRRVASYSAQSQSGKVDGNAVPVAQKVAAATLKVDAANGFAYPALDLIQDQLPVMARECGIALAGVSRSHHCGVAGVVVEKLANAGLVCYRGTRVLFGSMARRGRTAAVRPRVCVALRVQTCLPAKFNFPSPCQKESLV